MSKTLTEKLYLDNWPKRRRWMLVILTWALVNAQYIIVWGDDTALMQNAFYAIMGLIGAILGTYVFGATWDDLDKRRHFRPSGDQPDAEITE